MTGESAPTAGRIERGANTKVAYLDQARASLDDEATVFECVIGDLASVPVGGRDLTPRSYLERFLFDDAGQRSIVGTLSGGERARVAIAKLLAAPANVMVLDEPTNDLDIATLSALEEFLLGFGGTTIVVTHDRYFLDRVATSILAFEDRRGDAPFSRHLLELSRSARHPGGSRRGSGQGGGAQGFETAGGFEQVVVPRRARARVAAGSRSNPTRPRWLRSRRSWRILRSTPIVLRKSRGWSTIWRQHERKSTG